MPVDFESWFQKKIGTAWTSELDDLAFTIWHGEDSEEMKRTRRIIWGRLLKAQRMSPGMLDAFCSAACAMRWFRSR